MSLTATILGCGSSAGVPRRRSAGAHATPANPRNRRRRCSLLVERTVRKAVTRVLVDTSPDLREQLLDADVDWLDGVSITHEHADHTHGIDDLRSLFVHRRRRVDIHLDEPTAKVIFHALRLLLRDAAGQRLSAHRQRAPGHAGQALTIEGDGGPIVALPFAQEHGDIESLGFRFGPGVLDRCRRLAGREPRALAGSSVWIVDALRYRPHPSHFSVEDALDWIERLGPRRAVLTNLHVDLDYAALKSELPPHIEPAYDGMRLQVG